MVKIKGLKIPFTGAGLTDHISLLAGRYALSMNLAGSTVILMGKLRSEAVFKPINLPDSSASTAVDQIIEIAGGIDLQINVSAYVAPGNIELSCIQHS